jgi:DNA-binding MarR family transcriptional regulator
MNRDVLAVLVAYPQIWHACHSQHQRGTHSGHPLTEREASLLSHLSAFAPASPKRLAHHLGISAGTLSEAIEGLVQRGLVDRVRRQDDRRRQDLFVSARGERALVKGSVLDERRVLRALKRLSARERVRAVEGISLLAKACQ